MKQNKKKAMKVPFYAQLLTKQEMQHVGGAPVSKPSLDQAQTQKYPSDQEDTSPQFDEAQTQKYPSDGDDSTPVNDVIDQ